MYWPELLHILVEIVEIQLLFDHKPWCEPRRKEDERKDIDDDGWTGSVVVGARERVGRT